MPQRNTIRRYFEGGYYHVYNRGVEKRIIFKDDKDYINFISRIEYYLTPKKPIGKENPSKNTPYWRSKLDKNEVEIIAYCLMPNHFHFLIKPKPVYPGTEEKCVTEGLRMFFQIYVQYFNKKYGRRGSLFFKSFRRLEIIEDIQLKYLVFYIHYNPQKHGVINDFQKYRYSSYRFFFLDKDTHLRKKEVLEWFYNSLGDFETYHKDCMERNGLIFFEPGTPSLGMESLL